MNRARGYSMAEVIVVLALFGAFLLIIFILTSEMKRVERKYPVNLMTHPSISSVVSRLRKDVIDATTPWYPEAHDNYTQTNETLIVYSLQETGYAQTVVWDFRGKGEVRRRVYSAGEMLTSEWVAKGVPKFSIETYHLAFRPDAVRITAKDEKGRLAIDQIFGPRAYK